MRREKLPARPSCHEAEDAAADDRRGRGLVEDHFREVGCERLGVVRRSRVRSKAVMTKELDAEASRSKATGTGFELDGSP